MKKSIGMTFTLNIMIVFILVSFAFLAGIFSYAKAFKAASLIIKSLEKYEGYNELSYNTINQDLMTVGYLVGNSNKCDNTKKATIGTGNLVKINDLDNNKKENFNYCIYKFNNDGDSKHYSYGVVTYMTIDLSMLNWQMKFPVYARTKRIYRFG